MSKVLIPIPTNGFDPSEAAIPWKLLSERGHDITFATPDGNLAKADPIMVTGKGLWFLKFSMRADRNSRLAYSKMIEAPEFKNPIKYSDISVEEYSALILPGGHAKDVRPYLESAILQDVTLRFMEAKKTIAAICHGVLILARTIDLKTRKSIIYDKKITVLPNWMENLAYFLTCAWMGTYYRTYPGLSTQNEVKAAISDQNNISIGPYGLDRDSLEKPSPGFCVVDKNIITARWPGDVHCFSLEILKRLDS